ncbi:unnamed protein product [Psylliodes chrysocephalus]|uniref:Regulatory protein zeste n=1 Tax=Psylliodes chrysocephalus TaxID=3402493 RepID=A0A9P0CUV1_9CUCU|nr:unnamed protein product [Psylliodes chrysocephala]
MEQRGSRITEKQRETLVEFMCRHPELVSGKFTRTFTALVAQKLWKSLELELNSMPGSKKDWRQWRKSWHDIKSKVKTKNAKIKSYQRGTGGGAAIKDILSKWEENVMNVICPTSSLGHPSASESVIEFDFEDEMQQVEEEQEVEGNEYKQFQFMDHSYVENMENSYTELENPIVEIENQPPLPKGKIYFIKQTLQLTN